MKAPIVMVHGAFCGAWAFDRFRQPFEAAGHQVLTPDLRGHGAGAAAEAVINVSMHDYADDIARLCEEQAHPPILIGHSMGGLVAAMAAAKTQVQALVLLAPSAPWGVSASSMEEAITAFGLHLLGPFWAQSVAPDAELMKRYSLDRTDRADRDAIVARLRPESGRALWETLNWWLDPFMTTRVGPTGAPCLVIAGERDVVHPPATVRQTAAQLDATFIEAPGMSHWLPGEPGWREVAEIALGWLEGLHEAA
ncbi:MULTISPECIES: alpha/beta fold hydrolase [Phenylobacterium]|uniref:Pimeloyl-ACP methyl ester carboxylesterase n=1 Tax=Phenylobacterium koreense TaxID=266125 RepID=A0ABV2EIL6_9CAUL